MRYITLGDTFDFKFTTRRFSTGAPHTLASSPVVSAYLDNNTTEVTAGITLTADFDSRTGLNNVRVVASGGNGYSAGTWVFVITTGTVDSVSVVGEVVYEVVIGTVPANVKEFGGTAGTFSSGRPEVNTTHVAGTSQTARDLGASVLLSSGTGTGQLDFTSGVVKANVTQFGGTNATSTGGRPEVNTTHVAGTSQTARDLGASVLLSNGTGTGQVKLASGYVAPNWGDVGNPTTTVTLSGTTVKTATDVETDTQDIQSKIGTPAGASVAADIADVRSEMDRSRLRGTVDSGATTTSIPIKSINATLTDVDQLKGRVILFDRTTASAALQGQGAPINGSDTGEITLDAGDALSSAPAEDDSFVIV